MRPKLLLAVVAIASGCLVAIASLRWLDPEPAVYDAAIGNVYSSDIAVASVPSTCRAEEANLKSFSPTLVKAFQEANAPGASLADVSRLRNHFAVANSKQLAALAAQDLTSWVAGSAHVPIVRFSRVGFAPDKSEALFCIQAQHGSSLIHLRKADGAWRVQQQEPIWVSALMSYNYSLKRTAATACGTIVQIAAAAA